MSAVGGEPRRLHPATLAVRWLKVIPQAAAGIVAAGIGIANSGRGLWPILLMVAIASVVALFFVLLAWWRFTYTIGAGEIVIERGILHRQRRVIPFDRIQDIAIEQPLLARVFGTARVRIETGGSAKDEGNLDMIALADAHALRDRVRRGGAFAPAAGGGADEENPALAEEPVLFAMDFPRLLLAGLFNFSLIFLAAIMAVLQYLEQFGLVDWEELVTSRRADEAAAFLTIQASLTLAALILVLGLVAGVVRTVMRDFGFRLTRAPAGFRRRRGLFTLSEVVIPLRRTQAALIESGPIARLFGWHSLSFQTLGADRKEGGVQVAAPFARMAELLPILAEAGFSAPPERGDFQRMPRRGLIRRAAPWLALAGVAAAAAFTIEPWVGAAAAVATLFALGAVLRWRKHGWALGETALFVSGGLLKRRIWVVPFEKTQTLWVTRGPVQRPLKLASLLVDTAGGSPLNAPEIVDLEADAAETLQMRLLALFYPARARVRLQQG